MTSRSAMMASSRDSAGCRRLSGDASSWGTAAAVSEFGVAVVFKDRSVLRAGGAME
jgi:hypothetical protein